jgi:hypothetical protein
MKTTNTIFKLFFLSLFLLACSAEDPAELDGSLYEPGIEIPEESAGTFTAKVNGEDFVVDVVTAKLESYIDPNTGESKSSILITGKQANEAITLRIPANSAPNNITNPYELGPLTIDNEYAAIYNTNVTNFESEIITVSQATTLSNLNMVIGESSSKWVSDRTIASISPTETKISAGKGARGESLEFVLQTTETGTYTFGSTTLNTAVYTEPGNFPGVFEADPTIESGTITLRIDEVNKLISGEFNFTGLNSFSSSATPPSNIDTDGDGLLDEIELELGFDPEDVCSPIMPQGYEGYDVTNPIWLSGDCDGDSITNEEELNGPDGDIATEDDNTDPYGENGPDTDGDGISDIQEDINDVSGDSKNDPCLPVQNEFYTLYDASNSTWSSADCDGDTINNGDELVGPDGDITSTDDNTNPFFKDFTTEQFNSGSFTNVPYAEPDVKRGLNISTHDISAKRIVGTYSFIAASIGEDPAQWNIITDGTFDVNYTEVPE